MYDQTNVGLVCRVGSGSNVTLPFSRSDFALFVTSILRVRSIFMGHAVTQGVEACMVVCSVPDGVIWIFHGPNPTGRTMTQ